MLAFSFFVTILMSIIWLAGFGFYVMIHLPNLDFVSLSLVDAVLYMVGGLLPLFILWFWWGKVCAWRHEAMLQKQFNLLSRQIQQNQEYSDVIARILLKNGQRQSHTYALGKIEMYIGEMNEILSDILERCGFVDEKMLFSLWKNVGFGNRWGFAKTIVNLYNNDADFENKLVAKAQENGILSGSITEFCARYTRLLGLLKEHDEENILQDVIETGAFGKVFSIFALVVRKLHGQADVETDNNIAGKEMQSTNGKKTEEKDKKSNLKSKPDASSHKQSKVKQKSMWSKIFDKHKNEEEYIARNDPLTIALERSFGGDSMPSSASEELREVKKDFSAVPDIVLPEQTNSPEPIIKPQDTVDIETSELKFLLSDSAEINEPYFSEDIDPKTDDNSVYVEIEPTTEEKPEKFEASSFSASEASDNPFAFSNTEEVLKDLQKEWGSISPNTEKKETEVNE